MHKHAPTLVLVAALTGGLAFAMIPDAPRASPSPAVPSEVADRGAPTHAAAMLDAVMPSAVADLRPSRLSWTTPKGWHEAPNPSSMRIATYRIPRAPGDADDADLSVVQAGGSTDANIERWLGQFDDAGKESRAVRTIAGVKVTVVEVRGTYQGGGMTMGASADGSQPHVRWALLAAIVETPGAPYFFKMVGPEKTVAAARAPFDALLLSLTPEAADATSATGASSPHAGL